MKLRQVPGEKFTSLVADVRIGGYKGRIRKFKISGNMIYLGELPYSFPSDRWMDGLIFSRTQKEDGRDIGRVYPQGFPHGSDLDQIRELLVKMSEKLDLFPAFIDRLGEETFLGDDHVFMKEGCNLGQALSAIWFGSGPNAGLKDSWMLRTTCFARRTEIPLVVELQALYEGEISAPICRSHEYKVILRIRLHDNGFRLIIDGIKDKTLDANVDSETPTDLAQAITAFIKGKIVAEMMNNGFVFEDVDEGCRLVAVPKMPGRELIKLFKESIERAGIIILATSD